MEDLLHNKMFTHLLLKNRHLIKINCEKLMSCPLATGVCLAWHETV